MVNKTVGSGGDYATWSDAYDYILSLVTLTDDYTFTQISNVTVTTWNDGSSSFNLNGYQVKFTCSNWHFGDVTRGYITTLSGSASGMHVRPTGSSASSKFIFEKLNIRCTGTGAAALFINPPGSVNVLSEEYSNIIIIGDDKAQWTAIRIGNTYDYTHIYNCKISYMYSGLYMFPGFYTPGMPDTNRTFVENVSIYDVRGNGIYLSYYNDGYNVYFRNVYIWKTSGSGCIAYYGSSTSNNCTFQNCLVSDTTLVSGGGSRGLTIIDCQDSFDFTGQFLSTVNTSPLFLLPTRKSPGTLYALGTVPTLMVADISNYAIPDYAGKYPVGCHTSQEVVVSVFITSKRTMGLKTEGTPYTAETLAVTDYNIPAYNINYDVDIPVKDRKLAAGDYSHHKGVAGRRKFTCSFSVDLTMGAAAATAPTYWAALKACGLKSNTHGSTGISLTPDISASNAPCTIEIVEKDEGTSPVQLVIKAKGCMGNAKVIMSSVGEPVRVDFDMQGSLVSITDRAFASIFNPTGFDTAVPDVVLGATCTAFGENQRIGSLTLDLGNQVELFSDPTSTSGYEGAHVVGRDAVLDIDPDMDLIANRGNFTRLTGNTTGALVFQTQNFTISAPQAQIIQAYKPGDREGHVTSGIRFRLTRDTNGNDEFRILQRSLT